MNIMTLDSVRALAELLCSQISEPAELWLPDGMSITVEALMYCKKEGIAVKQFNGTEEKESVLVAKKEAPE